MLRLLVALLLLANLVFWALSRDDVARALGLDSPSDREPARLARQIRPEAVKLLTAAGASGPAASAAVVLSCLESGPLSDAEAAVATRELQQAGVPAGAWIDMRRELPGRWLVYMGRFADREQVRRKSLELQRLSLPFEEVLDMPELSPGLLLGSFDNDAEAQARLAQLRARGVRTARVLPPSAPGAEHRLRVDRLAPEQRARLQALAASAAGPSPGSSAASAVAARRWSACSAPP
ncbi:MAG TPA: hypothetical protein VLA16_14000 [Ideonella sp.]|nr:hypothetical protein [Ideonella sp.]